MCSNAIAVMAERAYCCDLPMRNPPPHSSWGSSAAVPPDAALRSSAGGHRCARPGLLDRRTGCEIRWLRARSRAITGGFRPVPNGGPLDLVGVLRYHIRSLTDFTGRESRGMFWPYLAVVVIGGMALLMSATMPMMLSSMGRIERYAQAHPEQSHVVRTPGHTTITVEGDHPDLIPEFGGMGIVMSVGGLLIVLLLAAAITRRLHDLDRSGRAALPPLVFLLVALLLMPFALRSNGASPVLFLPLFLNNMLYLATVARLLFQLSRPGTPGENQFGAPPGSARGAT